MARGGLGLVPGRSSACQDYVTAAITERSRASYNSALNSYRRFLRTGVGQHFNEWSAADNALAEFAAYMARTEGLAPRTIKTYTSAVASLWAEQGMSGARGPVLARVLTGINSLHADRGRPPRPPMTAEILRKLHLLPWTPHDKTLLTVLLVWSWLGMFRGGELVCGKSQRPLTLGNVWFVARDRFVNMGDEQLPQAGLEVLVIRPDHSKTRQTGSEAARTTEDHALHACGESLLCPIATLRSWLTWRAASPGATYTADAPLFVTKAGAIMTTSMLLSLMRRGLAELGVEDSHLYGTHSDRIGGSSARLAFGASMEAVASESSRRSTKSLVSYVRMSNGTATASRAIQTAIRAQPTQPLIFMPPQASHALRPTAAATRPAALRSASSNRAPPRPWQPREPLLPTGTAQRAPAGVKFPSYGVGPQFNGGTDPA